jgi:hypothetical protein
MRIGIATVSLFLCAFVADAAPRSTGPAGSWQQDWQELEALLRKRPEAYTKDPHILDPQALIRPDDRDPLDVELRRAEALLSDLKQMPGAPDLVGPGNELASIRKEAASVQPADGPKRKALYLQARAVRRRIALANPLLDFEEILLTTGVPSGAHIQSHFYGRSARRNDLLVLSNYKGERPKTRKLLQGARVSGGRNDGRELTGGRVYTLDLSWDGKILLFDHSACKPPADYGEDSIFNPSHMTPDLSYNIFRLDLASMELRQLTDTMYNDACPAWLPDGRVVFTSDRRGAYVRCHPHGPPEKPFARRGHHQPCSTLFTMKADGTDVVPISWHETSETFPRVAHDGRIVYTRWDYIDREFHAGHHIWFCTPDGRDPRAPHGNYPFPHSTLDEQSPFRTKSGGYRDGRHLRPWAEYGIRPVPGSERFVAVASTHHSRPVGQLVLIDPTVPDDGKMSQVRKVAPGPLPHEGWGLSAEQRRNQPMPFAWPWPLSENYHLVRYGERGWLVLLDRFGNRDVLWTGQTLFAVPRKSRSRPPVIPTATFQGERAGQPGHQPATISVMNVYEADFVWPKGTKIAALRIVQIFPRPWSSPFNNVGKNYSNGAINRMSLGTVPVEADGSAYFEAPVECEIYFQALDERGLAVQSMRSGTYVHPGEHLSCLGCHEDKWKSKQPPGGVQALKRGPSKIAPEVGGVEPASYYRLVKPVLERTCIPCHEKEGKGQRTADYVKLEPYAFYFHGSGGGLKPQHGGYRTLAGRFGARESKLGRVLLGDAHQRRLKEGRFTEEDFRRICLWLDLNSMELGSSSIKPEDQAKQRSGVIVQPRIDFDPKNPQRVERVPAPKTPSSARAD